MKFASWSDCLISNVALQVSPDKSKARSLKELADWRLAFLKSLSQTEMSANFIFEGFYSSVMEYIHALVLMKGFKIENHICLGFFIKDILHDEGTYRIYNDCRIKRNNLVYYGTKMDFETAQATIKKCETLLVRVDSLLKVCFN